MGKDSERRDASPEKEEKRRGMADDEPDMTAGGDPPSGARGQQDGYDVAMIEQGMNILGALARR